MKNVECKVDKNKLIITVDLTKDHGPSSTGKTIIVATSEGNVKVGDTNVQFGLNVFKKKDKEA